MVAETRTFNLAVLKPLLQQLLHRPGLFSSWENNTLITLVIISKLSRLFPSSKSSHVTVHNCSFFSLHRVTGHILASILWISYRFPLHHWLSFSYIICAFLFSVHKSLPELIPYFSFLFILSGNTNYFITKIFCFAKEILTDPLLV